jgi:hypothetical protein
MVHCCLMTCQEPSLYYDEFLNLGKWDRCVGVLWDDIEE